jgi:predicted dithiol-disulfide oxidoreductase (DUF899 family)
MTTEHRIATREEWLTARRELLEDEKQLTRMSDELARRRRELPWVPLDKTYTFDAPDGPRTLAELFDGRSQLLVYHFMFGPDWGAGCPSCSSIGDHIDGPMVHLENHDVTMACVSRAPIEKLEAYKRRMGWSFPWLSSGRSDFNFDFGVSFTPDQLATGVDYNFARIEDDPRYLSEELPGMSAFALEDGVVHHTYSAYARGCDALWGMYQWLDRAPKGRNEAADPAWVRRRDEYATAGVAG